MGSRVADLMQAKAALLSSAAEARLQTVENEHSDKLQQLRLEVADKECQVCPNVLPFALRWRIFCGLCRVRVQRSDLA